MSLNMGYWMIQLAVSSMVSALSSRLQWWTTTWKYKPNKSFLTPSCCGQSCFYHRTGRQKDIYPVSKPLYKPELGQHRQSEPVPLELGTSKACPLNCLLWHPWEIEGPYSCVGPGLSHLLACVALSLSSAGEILFCRFSLPFLGLLSPPWVSAGRLAYSFCITDPNPHWVYQLRQAQRGNHCILSVPCLLLCAMDWCVPLDLGWL